MLKNIPFYDLKLAASTARLVGKTLKSGWLTTGPAVEQFESGLSNLLHIKHTAAVNSATSGLTLALRAVGVRPGSEVITSSFAFVAGVESILNLGATPVLVDIDPKTLNIDPKEVAQKVTKRTVAILSVDIAGFPCDYKGLHHIAKEHGVSIVSDSAHALGAMLDGKSMPHWTDLSVFSFHATKNLTCGEGGMVVSRDKKLIERIRLWSKHGMTASAYERKKQSSWSYDVVEHGFKANMSDILAAVGLGELKLFTTNQRRREQLAMRYLANLAGVEDFVSVPQLQIGPHHAWHLFIVQLNLGRLKISRDEVINKLKSAGIGCSVHYRPIHTLSFANGVIKTAKKLPNAEQAGQSVISLPLYPLLKPVDVENVCDRMVSILRRHSR